MSDVTDALKQYWPYAVGGLVGLFLLARMGGGNNAPAADNTYSMLMASQASASAANTQAATQLQIAQAQIGAAERASDREYSLNLATLAAKKDAAYIDGFNQFQSAQAAMAQSVGSSAAQVISALNAPGIAAMNNAATENGYAMLAAAEVAKAEFQSMAAMSTTNDQSNQIGALASLAGQTANSAFMSAETAAASKGQTQQAGIGGTLGLVSSIFGGF